MSQTPRSGGRLGSSRSGDARNRKPPAPRAIPTRKSRKPAPPSCFASLAEVKGQAQFLLYLADQIDDSLQQLADETEPGHTAFLCRLLSMYSAQLETKHQGLGDKIAETCQEVYVTVREHDAL